MGGEASKDVYSLGCTTISVVVITSVSESLSSHMMFCGVGQVGRSAPRVAHSSSRK